MAQLDPLKTLVSPAAWRRDTSPSGTANPGGHSLVDDDSAIHGEPGFCGERRIGAHPCGNDDGLSRHDAAALNLHAGDLAIAQDLFGASTDNDVDAERFHEVLQQP